MHLFNHETVIHLQAEKASMLKRIRVWWWLKLAQRYDKRDQSKKMENTIRRLGELGGDKARTYLETLVRFSKRYGMDALRALAQLSDPRTSPSVLISALKDGEYVGPIQAACHALRTIDWAPQTLEQRILKALLSRPSVFETPAGEETINALVTLTSYPDPVRSDAAKALSEIAKREGDKSRTIITSQLDKAVADISKSTEKWRDWRQGRYAFLCTLLDSIEPGAGSRARSRYRPPHPGYAPLFGSLEFRK